MENDVCFIDKIGKRVRCDTIASHMGLANLMLKEMPELGEEFKKSGKQDPVDFLISNKGYIKVTTQGRYKSVVYDSSTTISNMQRELLIHYRELGYSLDDLEAMRRRKNKSRWVEEEVGKQKSNLNFNKNKYIVNKYYWRKKWLKKETIMKY